MLGSVDCACALSEWCLYKSLIHPEMVVWLQQQRQTKYNEKYTQITVKHYKIGKI